MNRLNNSVCPIRDPQVIRVLERMNNERKHPPQELFLDAPALDPEKFSRYGFSISPEQGELIYLLCRAMKATRVVDFATSVSMSALYFAAAMKDNGGGLVIGSEMVQEKAEMACKNLAEVGLTSFVDIRVGDARETLKDLGGPVDFILIDGFPLADGPSLARQVTEIVAPQLRVGGYILNDNAEP
ncbi:TPA: class I SAM-dependent methyltransferase, partial [Escherichia coli]|nr:class I SAM-dependent methyltransferase [Escherichia coli]